MFRLRISREESSIIFPLDSYKTWIDAGVLDPLVLDHPDPNYNANVWRHFSRKEGVTLPETRKRISSVIASMYPLCIPPPSRMGEFTYARFIKNGDIYRDPLLKKKKITCTEMELQVGKTFNNLLKYFWFLFNKIFLKFP